MWSRPLHGIRPAVRPCTRPQRTRVTRRPRCRAGGASNAAPAARAHATPPAGRHASAMCLLRDLLRPRSPLEGPATGTCAPCAVASLGRMRTAGPLQRRASCRSPRRSHSADSRAHSRRYAAMPASGARPAANDRRHTAASAPRLYSRVVWPKPASRMQMTAVFTRFPQPCRAERRQHASRQTGHHTRPAVTRPADSTPSQAGHHGAGQGLAPGGGRAGLGMARARAQGGAGARAPAWQRCRRPAGRAARARPRPPRRARRPRQPPAGTPRRRRSRRRTAGRPRQPGRVSAGCCVALGHPHLAGLRSPELSRTCAPTAHACAAGRPARYVQMWHRPG